MYCMTYIQNPVYYRRLTHIKACSLPILEPGHIQNPGISRTQNIFRTLSRHILAYSELWSYMETFKKYVLSRFPSFEQPPLFIIPSPSPLVCPCSFLRNPILPTSPPPTHHAQGTFVLAKTHSLPPPPPHPYPPVAILVKFREEKLTMSTSISGWTQRVF